MANDVNVAVVVGRLTKDTEYRTFQSGSSVCTFSVAVNRRVKRGDSWEDEPNYIEVQLYGKAADNLRQYLTKGRQVSVNGELRQQSWEQNGQKRSKLIIVAGNVQLLSSPSGSAQTDSGRTGTGTPVENGSTAAQPLSGGPEDFEDDIPF